MKVTEHQIQSAFFQWWDLHHRSPLCWAIPNGGKRHIGVARKLKTEGVRSGVPDVFIAIPAGIWHGLFLEFKTRTGQISASQKIYHQALTEQNYRVLVVRSFEEAVDSVEKYLNIWK